MIKERYSSPKAEITVFSIYDVITSSGYSGPDGTDPVTGKDIHIDVEVF